MRYQPASALRLISASPPDRPVVVAQLGQTLDGRIATVTGDSKYINGDAALVHLHRLRAHVDAVVVGVGTVEADDPQLTVRRVEGDSPARVIIDPNGRASWRARLFQDGETPVYTVTKPGAATVAGAEAIEIAEVDGQIDPCDIVEELAARGMRKILVEGGADTLSRFLSSDAIDLLHVLVAPMIFGSGKSSVVLPPIERLDQALRPQTDVHVFEDGDVLFTCDLREQEEVRDVRAANL
jgi:riboflavin-specific deaminase-like protein